MDKRVNRFTVRLTDEELKRFDHYRALRRSGGSDLSVSDVIRLSLAVVTSQPVI